MGTRAKPERRQAHSGPPENGGGRAMPRQRGAEWIAYPNWPSAWGIRAVEHHKKRLEKAAEAGLPHRPPRGKDGAKSALNGRTLPWRSAVRGVPPARQLAFCLAMPRPPINSGNPIPCRSCSAAARTMPRRSLSGPRPQGPNGAPFFPQPTETALSLRQGGAAGEYEQFPPAEHPADSERAGTSKQWERLCGSPA